MKTELTEIHKNCHKIFRQGFYETPEDINDENLKYYGPTSACRIYDKLTEGDDNLQDCIGENFNQLIQKVEGNWFENYTPQFDLDYYFFNYILLLYLFVERIDIIFEVLNKDGKSKLFIDFQEHNFKTLRKINKWANFIKHPKEFLFTHWPKYYIEGDKSINLKDTDVKINTDFIFAHYHNEKQQRPVILQNNQQVFVEIPNLENITKEFCREMNVFFDFICSNQIVADFLKKKSTIEQHFDFEESSNLDINEFNQN
jgi:hypothetical protein